MRLLLLSLFLMMNVYAFKINEIEVKCTGSDDCNIVESSFKSLRRKYTDYSHFKKTVKLYVLNKGVNYFSYQVVKRKKVNVLSIDLSLKKEIGSINIRNSEGLNLPSILPVVVGDYYNNQKIKTTANLIRSVVVSRGYPNAYVKSKS